MPSGSMRASRSRIFSCSGPMPSSGLIAPSRTWYRPWNSPVRSTATMSRDSSTTHTTRLSRRSSVQNWQSSESVTLKQRAQKRTFSLASRIAAASLPTSSAGIFSRWKAIRCAERGPIPGSRPSSSISVCTGGEKALAIAQSSSPTRVAPGNASERRSSADGPPLSTGCESSSSWWSSTAGRSPVRVAPEVSGQLRPPTPSAR